MTQSLILDFLYRISSVRGIGGCNGFDRGKSRCFPAASECSDPIDEAENGDPDLQNMSETQSTHLKLTYVICEDTTLQRPDKQSVCM